MLVLYLLADLLDSLTALAAPVARSSTPMAGLVMVPTTPSPRPTAIHMAVIITLWGGGGFSDSAEAS